MEISFWLLFAIGFFAQIVDGAVGMAYGTVSTALLQSFGVHPATASATVHGAKLFTNGFSSLSHIWKKNIDWRLTAVLTVTGVTGGVVGALVVSWVDPAVIRPVVTIYLLLMGVYILFKSWRYLERVAPHPERAVPVGLFGGFCDAVGGGGWGPIVTTTLVGSGHKPRYVIGSQGIAEFTLSVAVTAVFGASLGAVFLDDALGLLIGGLIAAPFAGMVVAVIRPQILMTMVGSLVIALSVFRLIALVH